MVVAGVGGPADLFLFYLLQSAGAVVYCVLNLERIEMNCIIRMRHDLAQEGYSVPASRTFSNYDTLDDDLYISAEELEGATYADDPADPDDHPFCYLQLRDGRSLYFIGADLDFIYKLKIVQTE